MMAVEMDCYGSKKAVEEAACAGVESVERLIKMLSGQQIRQEQEIGTECRAAADAAVARFRKLIGLLGGTAAGHARFRRGPLVKEKGVEGEESSGSRVVCCRKVIQWLPPLPLSERSRKASAGKRKCGSMSEEGSARCEGRCHCFKRRKVRVKRTVRVPAVGIKMADVPADNFTWRKYGQKPIKGSPHPRSYYKCSSVRGCPARKHVERAADDPAMMVISYEGDHNHTASRPFSSDRASPRFLLLDPS